jgi:hypothetical protein
MADDFVTRSEERARRQHPELFRHPSLKPGQWRYDPEFGRRHNPTTFAEEGGYSGQRQAPTAAQEQDQAAAPKPAPPPGGRQERPR